MRKTYVIGNWKMNGSKAANKALLDGLKAGVPAIKAGVAIAVCPPFAYLESVVAETAGSVIGVGSQDVSEYDKGAYTGEISVSMLKDVGVTYAVIGHSERRALFGETDEWVGKKTVAALAGGLVPVVCVGETEAERVGNQTEAVLAKQLDAILAAVPNAAPGSIVIAYEPVWAIGTGKTATPEMAQETHAFIRNYIKKAGEAFAAETAILYGGSVKASNALGLFAMPDIDGGLVGGASLIVEEFVGVYNGAADAFAKR
ncbi:triose-phosphate isomerase [Niveibacterium sp. 24ML]|uniref:triose-phosphate isomerase n=1 Tax=Niveibacterium sp. 24ML TaxID=2985512 RepID=UPI00226F6107|nr:triose-phosphate isomerase [Niveibacterium sp. 24ML]MCX9157089.1 triose-phosphate isomerase [Niveibacterium sp. 24ML]